MATIETIQALIQDYTILEDEQILAFMEIESNTYRVAALCCRSLAAYYAKKVSLTVDVIKIANEQKFEHYINLAKIYDQRAREGGGDSGGTIGSGIVLTGVSINEMDTVIANADRVDPAFSMGLNDNPESSIDSDEVIG